MLSEFNALPYIHSPHDSTFNSSCRGRDATIWYPIQVGIGNLNTTYPQSLIRVQLSGLYRTLFSYPLNYLLELRTSKIKVMGKSNYETHLVLVVYIAITGDWLFPNVARRIIII